ncbi:hypothetical protein EJ05DRAFT_161253 [Pseudovirgaria hyperparasitica]|uniref:Uncharacterized protein n=1 Tax=Pseudovirgaria hyperparasitica TaxID=470096 RepID=A0A6A6VTS2_9PEZI|nr:uncharacterized protein EJ05DRAFT_161253 [Pseudovirgaria hyperparasitica]KAF2753972.1 hypothetical protein EJ05DRAFT_161253 [Pseudovirgaria hyperparasitica]
MRRTITLHRPNLHQKRIFSCQEFQLIPSLCKNFHINPYPQYHTHKHTKFHKLYHRQAHRHPK